MSLVVVTSDRFADHITPPGHPERVGARRGHAGGRVPVAASRRRHPGAACGEPTRIWCACTMRPTCNPSSRRAAVRSMLDPDTFTSPESEEVARLAAGAVLTGIDHVLDGRKRAAVRS